jgi:hypothetical protein
VGHAQRDRPQQGRDQQIPFGEYPKLVAQGIKNTGSDNFGGPVVTAGGLLFIGGATSFDKKFRAFDKLTATGNTAPFVALRCRREIEKSRMGRAMIRETSVAPW